MTLRALVSVVVLVGLAGAAHGATFAEKDQATLRALDKITGRSTDIDVKVGEPVVFGSLKVELKACYQTPPEEAPESAAFLKIFSTQPVAVVTMDEAVDANDVETVSDENPELFSGWMYASSPGLSALEHPVYDIWVIRCTAPDPVKLPNTSRPPLAGDDAAVEEVPPGIDIVEEPPGGLDPQ